MKFIETSCFVQKPVDGYFINCLRILTIDWYIWSWAIGLSLISGFLFYLIYLKAKKVDFNIKNYLKNALLISLILLILFLITFKLFDFISSFGRMY